MDPREQWELLSEAGATLCSEEEFLQESREALEHLKSRETRGVSQGFRLSFNFSMVVTTGAFMALGGATLGVLVAAPLAALVVSDILWDVLNDE